MDNIFWYFFEEYIFIRNLLKDYLTYYNSMNKNNTNININEDICKIFYSTLLIEIKKMIKKFQWRKACRKYRTNNKERFNKISN